MKKEQITKDDGRKLIFYHFAAEAAAPVNASAKSNDEANTQAPKEQERV